MRGDDVDQRPSSGASAADASRVEQPSFALAARAAHAPQLLLPSAPTPPQHPATNAVAIAAVNPTAKRHFKFSVSMGRIVAIIAPGVRLVVRFGIA
jgi:hypothetical protein